MPYIDLDQAKKKLMAAVENKQLPLSSNDAAKVLSLLDQLPKITPTEPQEILEDFRADMRHQNREEGAVPVSEVEDFLFNYT